MTEQTGMVAIAISVIEEYTGLPISVAIFTLVVLILDVAYRRLPTEKKGGIIGGVFKLLTRILDVFVADRVIGEKSSSIKDRIKKVFKKS